MTFHIENTCYMLNKKLTGDDKNISVLLLPSEYNWVCLLGHTMPPRIQWAFLISIENQEFLWRQLCHHWCCLNLSLWQPLVWKIFWHRKIDKMMKNSSFYLNQTTSIKICTWRRILITWNWYILAHEIFSPNMHWWANQAHSWLLRTLTFCVI